MWIGGRSLTRNRSSGFEEPNASNNLSLNKSWYSNVLLRSVWLFKLRFIASLPKTPCIVQVAGRSEIRGDRLGRSGAIMSRSNILAYIHPRLIVPWPVLSKSNPEDGEFATCSQICECQGQVAGIGAQPHNSQDSEFCCVFSR